jgi:NAD(P)-dependent dehydrogenase (short-subunit alcohol dehydrogenase family)
MKTVLITGASGSLGRTVVQRFLDDGYKVVATVISEKEKASLSSHEQLVVETVNLADESAVENFITKTASEQNIDTALLLAGGYAYGGIADASHDVIEQQLAINFYTAYHIARPLFQHMTEKGSGRIVFIGAQPALVPAKGKSSLAYSLSKSLLFKLSEMLNEEAKGSDVVTSVVAPSTIDTQPNREAMPDADFSRWVKAGEIADVLAFFCSSQAKVLREPIFKVYGAAL